VRERVLLQLQHAGAAARARHPAAGRSRLRPADDGRRPRRGGRRCRARLARHRAAAGGRADRLRAGAGRPPR
jgi:hypothetical protein